MQDNSSIVKNKFATEEATAAQVQLTEKEMTEHLGKLIAESPSRQRRRFLADFTLTPEYEKLSRVDTSMMSAKEAEQHASKMLHIKRYGTFTDEQRQREISNSLSIPLSEVIALRDRYKAEIDSLEAEMDGFDTSSFDSKAEELSIKYKQRAKGMSGIQLSSLQCNYDKEYDALMLEEYTKPRNALAVKRQEAIEKYKVYEHRLRLYCSLNKDMIVKQIEKAKEEEISTNLSALASYFEET